MKKIFTLTLGLLLTAGASYGASPKEGGPLRFSHRHAEPSGGLFAVPTKQKRLNVPIRVSTQGRPEIIANCTSSKLGHGMYSFFAEEGLELNRVGDTPAFFGGAVYVNGKYYGCDYDYDYNNDNQLIYVRWYVYDALTWHLDRMTECPLSYSYIATDRTYDETEGTVYSINYDRYGNTIWLATTELETGRPTLIAQLEKDVIMLAASPEGILYGLDTEGNLYRVGKGDAKLTLVGKTNIYDDYNSQYTQALTFDKKTGKLYWVEFHSEGLFTGASALFEVDPKTAAAVKIADLPGGPEMIGAYVGDYQTPGVPDVVTDIQAVPASEGSTTFTLMFTMPQKTVDGLPLGNGKMNVDLKIDDVTIDTKEAVAGQQLTAGPYTLDRGLRTLKVCAGNATGPGAVAAKMFYAGYDVPAAPANVTLTAEGGDAVVTWDAVTDGAEGGVLRKPVKYTVMRMPDEEIVAEDLDATSFRESVTQAARVSYIVKGVTAEGEGLPGESNSLVMGAVQLPYVTSFATQEEFDMYTIVDLAGSGKPWNYDEDNQRLRHPWSMNVEMDDYAMSPPLAMNRETSYEIKFDAYQMVASYENEHVMLYFGPTTNIEEMELLLDTGHLSEKATTYSAIVAPKEEGPHYIAFRSMTGKNGFMSYVDDVSVKAKGSSAVPAPVTDLKAQAADGGELSVEISMVAPGTTLSGRELESIDRIELFRGAGNEPIKTFENPVPNQLLKWTDTSVSTGKYTYRAVVHAADGVSQEAAATVYAGTDTPLPVTDVTVTETADGNRVTWTAPKAGVNGGNLNGLLSYDVTRVVNEVPEPVAEGIGECEFNDMWTAEQQAFVYYSVTARTTAGGSDPANSASITAGKPYELPFKESFAGAQTSMQPWSVENVFGTEGSWKVNERGEDPYIAAQDGDGGLATFDGYHSFTRMCEVRLITPAIEINKFTDATLTYYVYHYNGYDQWSDETSPVEETMCIEISVDGKRFETIPGSEITSYATQNGWQQHSVFLGDYKQSKSVRLAFKGRSAGCFNIHLDNIAVDGKTPWSGIESVDMANLRIEGGKGILLFSGAQGGISVSNLAGMKMAESRQSAGSINLPAGVYVVTGNGCARKVIVK